MADNNTVNIKLAMQGLTQVEAGIKQLTSVFTNLEKAATGGALVFGAAKILDFTANATKAAGEIGKLSKKIGETTEDTSRLAYATKLGADELRVMFGHFEKWQAEHGRSGEGLIPGIFQLSDQLQSIESPAIRAQLVLDRFGRAGLDMLPFLQKGPQGIQELFEKADHLGVVTDDSAQRSRQFTQALYDLEYAKHHLSMEIGSVFIPSLQKVVNFLTEATVAVRHFIEEYPAAQHALEALAIAATGLATAISLKTVGAVTELTTATSLLSKAVAIAAVAFGGFNLGQAIGQVKLFGDTIHSHLENGFLGAMHAWELLRAKLGADNGQEIKDLEDAMLDKVLNPSGEPSSGPDIAPPKAGVTRDFDADRKRLDIQLSENRLIQQKLQLQNAYGIASSNDIKVLRAQLDIEQSIVDKRRELTEEQRKLGLLSDIEAAKLNLEDKAALMQIDKQRSDIKFADQHSLSEQMSLELDNLEKRFGTLQQNVAKGFTEVIGNAINTVSDHITNLIMGTETWNEALANIGRTILTGIINAIIRMFVTWIANLLILKALKAIFHTSDNTEAATSAAAWGPAAVAASIASYGSAAAVGTASAIAGMALGASVGAALSTGAGFEEGGYTGTMARSQVAGVVHGQEFVMNADATDRNLPLLEAMNAGKEVAQQPVAQHSKFNIGVFDDRSGLREFLQSAPGQAIVLDIVGKNRHLLA